MQIDCSECGSSFIATVSVGIGAKRDAALLTVPSFCDSCIDADPLLGIMVRDIDPTDVLEQEVNDSAE